jgi:hypothetical protein
MAELKQEQLMLAVEAQSEAIKRWQNTESEHMPWGTKKYHLGMCQSGLRAAAPYLQFPWENVTDQEISMIAEAQARDPFGVQCAVVAFVNMRNAALLPKPVDPRRKKIAEILMEPVSPLVLANFRTEAEVYADRILAALDEVK